MKKISLLIIVLLMTFIPVNAANYEMRELIPINIENTIVTNNFSYKSFVYVDNKEGVDKSKNHSIVFRGIKNLSDEAKPITISIGLFNSEKRNIGTINYCADSLQSKEEKDYEIKVTKDYLAKENTVNDIKYIAVLSENINCRKDGELDYVGQKVEDIGMKKNNTLSTDATFLLKVFGAVFGVIFLIFLYEFVFTSYYTNFDGKDIRTDYKKYNKELKARREFEERIHPTPPPVKKKTKTDEVLKQEAEAAKEGRDETELHNMYK
ncbi:MAG: hypothetical protein IJI22_02380 [Bacilli bacterium]|nr:hypothetical protein [Bacilli bacterium]